MFMNVRYASFAGTNTSKMLMYKKYAPLTRHFLSRMKSTEGLNGGFARAKTGQ